MSVKTFRDLRIWQKAHLLAVKTYRLTGNFPPKEIFGLVSQIRRSAHSVSSNIAEGFGRRGLKEKTHFLFIARGSVLETQGHLLLAIDLGYLDKLSGKEMDEEYAGLIAGINAMIKGLNRPAPHSSTTPNLQTSEPPHLPQPQQ